LVGKVQNRVKRGWENNIKGDLRQDEERGVDLGGAGSRQLAGL